MGRYYNGDIEGKFWVAVQPSDTADRFGVKGEPPNELVYFFDRSDLPKVEEELKRIDDYLGEKRIKLDKFFAEHSFYTDEQLCDLLGVKSFDRLRFILREYADYCLGVQVRDCIKQQGVCSFTAEC